MSDQQNEIDPVPSKSQLKREAEAMTELGNQLLQLDNRHLNQLDLPDNLLSAISEHHKIKQHGARKRQLLYIGKLLRKIDCSDIINKLESFKSESQQQTRFFHSLEKWRDKLLSDDQALTEILDAYPALNSQQLRQLIRSARKEISQNKPPAAARSLFKYLRTTLSED